MNDSAVADRAFTLSEMSSDDSVRMSVLAGREGRFADTEPTSDPPVTYLEATEAPMFLLTNGKRGIGLGVKNNTVTPDRGLRTVVLVTGRRTLCLVGQDDGDEVIEVPHESVAATSYSTGFRKHRLVLRTPRSAYHCWVHRKTDTDLLERITDYVDERRSEDPVAMTEESPSRVMYRGQPVANPQSSGGKEATADGGPTVNEEDGSDDGDEFTVTYRGQPVDRD